MEPTPVSYRMGRRAFTVERIWSVYVTTSLFLSTSSYEYIFCSGKNFNFCPSSLTRIAHPNGSTHHVHIPTPNPLRRGFTLVSGETLPYTDPRRRLNIPPCTPVEID